MVKWTASDLVLPGAAPVSKHSVFACVADAKPATQVEVRTTGKIPDDDRGHQLLDGLWERAVEPERALDPDVSFRARDGELAWRASLVPQNYGTEAELREYFGPVWYRRQLFRPPSWEHVDLVLHAVDYLADVVVGDRHLGRHEGYFAPFRFDLTDVFEPGGESALLVRVQDPLEIPPDDPLLFFVPKRCVKGVLNHHDSRRVGPAPPAEWTLEKQAASQSWPSGGIVGSVELRETGPVRLDALFVTALSVRGEVHLAVAMTHRREESLSVTLAVRIFDPDERPLGTSFVDAELAPGSNRLDLDGEIPDPELWYDAALDELGRPACYRIDVTAIVGDRVSDACDDTFGVRTVCFGEGPDWEYRLNDEPVFVRAANYIPVEHWAGLGEDFYARDFELLRSAHLHSVGVHAHVQSPACYRAADRTGISVFQDFPLQWAYDSHAERNPGFVARACAMAAEMLYLLWNRPSVVYWCAHNEPGHGILLSFARMMAARSGQPLPAELSDLPQDVLAPMGVTPERIGPVEDGLNQHLDRALAEVMKALDPLRMVHEASGHGHDQHEYAGNLGGGSIHDVGSGPRAPFVSEYGAFSVSPRARNGWPGRVEPWPPSEQQIQELCSGSIDFVAAVAAGEPGAYPSFEAWAYATERLVVFTVKHMTEFYRIHRGSPYRGYRWHMLVDHFGYAGAGLLDVDRVPTSGYHAMAAASRPRLAAATWDASLVEPKAVEVPVTLINDRRSAWATRLRWRIERLRACEVIWSKAVSEDVDPTYAAAVAPMDGKYVLPLPGTLDVLSAGVIEGEASASASAHAGEVAMPLDGPGAYRLVLQWEETGRREENDLTLLVPPDGWAPRRGLERIDFV